MYELERRMNGRSSLADFLFFFYQSRKTSIKSPRGRGTKRFTYIERDMRAAHYGPAAQCPLLFYVMALKLKFMAQVPRYRQSTMELYIRKEQWGLYPGHARVGRKVHRWLDKIVKGGEIRRQNGCITIIVQYPRLFNLIIFYRYFIAL